MVWDGGTLKYLIDKKNPKNNSFSFVVQSSCKNK
jgi:type I site-specific restriction-modification system R (restriction) subunit